MVVVTNHYGVKLKILDTECPRFVPVHPDVSRPICPRFAPASMGFSRACARMERGGEGLTRMFWDVTVNIAGQIQRASAQDEH